MVPSSHVNIDGDVLVYACGFAAETKMFVVDGRRFEDKADAAGYAERNGLSFDEAVDYEVVVEPLDVVLKSVAAMLDSIKEGAKAASATILLTGSGNFRHDVATLQEYKGNRGDRKPQLYQEIIDYLVHTRGAEVIEGEEADDQLSIRAMKRGDTIATVDKDLDNTPGWHYNWRRDELYYVGEVEANRNFYKQLLTGDSVDNIPGLYRLTGVKASKKFKDAVDELDDVAAMYDYVLSTYQAASEDSDVDAVEAINEIGQLLWMRREEGEVWTPPTKA